MVKFISASLDSSNLEPRCCNHGIDIQSTISRLPWASRTSIRHRYFLLTRGYCGNPSCSARLSMAKTDIGADGPARIIYCKTCRSTTCLKCRNLHHPGRSCRENDASLAQLLDLGKSSGWKRCTSCGALVERTDGCQYVKCRCGVYSKIPDRK
ncbi:hypothetical protein QBC42DRAFT_270583 [Cladorrhinum samala]|uniref:IBR domain-containing protein n=1 Tax=Cladorrhinum samala TaxID=585594 RepID=A0AAV9HKQ6_9PEZI|nr:hypothetical protein QBC42DRAFT_270583 [Cladorrhinum samala]